MSAWIAVTWEQVKRGEINLGKSQGSFSLIELIVNIAQASGKTIHNRANDRYG